MEPETTTFDESYLAEERNTGLFEVGDMVTFTGFHSWHVKDHGPGPFKVMEVIPVPEGALDSVGHPQWVKLDGIYSVIDPTELSLFSGLLVRKVQT